MELFESKNYFVILNGKSALFCDRCNGNLKVGKADDLESVWNPVCLGKVQGVIGKFRYFPDSEWQLLLIRNSQYVGDLYDGSKIYRISRIIILPLSTATLQNVEFELCNQHHFGMKKPEKITQPPDANKPFIKTVQQHIKSAAENVKPKKISSFFSSENNKPVKPKLTPFRKREVREREKFERRIQEELLKMFQEDESFYYCLEGDITTNLQRQYDSNYDKSLPIWKRCDKRFFWNEGLIQEVIDSYKRQGHGVPAIDPADIDAFVLPIMMGFVQIEKMEMPLSIEGCDQSTEIVVSLISRRNKMRAGTRFRRRGVDKDGNVANYVETEQFIQTMTGKQQHTVSFLLVRGSIPVYWSQSGFKYRPPIKLEKGTSENQEAFAKHIHKELETVDRLIAVSLVDTGPERSEKKISDSYLKHLLFMNDDRVTTVLFDFHEYCRGMHFENVSILLKELTTQFRDMKYCWVDDSGIICRQQSLFRVNCVDCLDRTNVVQCMFAGVVLETQLRKLGLLYPEDNLPASFHRRIQSMWANNGDAISQQYAGTVAMKGDFTRTGERTVNGLMKDGMSSMNRYYLRFRDITRQATLDLILCQEESADLNMLRHGAETDNVTVLREKEENIKLLTSQCKKLCLESDEDNLAESILIACNENEREMNDMNTVLLITTRNLYFVRIDSYNESRPVCLKIPLTVVRLVELGLEPAMFRSANHAMRIHFDITDPSSTENKNTSTITQPSSTSFLTFRQPSLRLFNNILVPVKTNDDALESLRAVSSGVLAAAGAIGTTVNFQEPEKLERIKASPLPEHLKAKITLDQFYSVCTNRTIRRSLMGIRMTRSSRSSHSSSRRESNKSQQDGAPAHNEGTVDSIKQTFLSMRDKVNLGNFKPSLPFRSTTSSAKSNDALAVPSGPSSKNASAASTPAASPQTPRKVTDKSEEPIRPKRLIATKQMQAAAVSDSDRATSDEDDDEYISSDDSFDEGDIQVFEWLKKTEEEAAQDSEPNNRVNKNLQDNILSNKATDDVLPSCGIVHTKLLADSQLENESGQTLNSVVASLAADPEREAQYQSRMARLSRHLSQGEFQLPTIAVNTITETIVENQSAERHFENADEEDNNTESLINEEVFERNISPRNSACAKQSHLYPRSMKLSFSETSLASRDNMNQGEAGAASDFVSVNASLAWIRKPHIELDNQRMTDRIRKRQVDYALEIENIRQQMLGAQDVKTELIVF